MRVLWLLVSGLLVLAVACVPSAPPAGAPSTATSPPNKPLHTVKAVHVPAVLFAPLYVALAKAAETVQRWAT